MNAKDCCIPVLCISDTSQTFSFGKTALPVILPIYCTSFPVDYYSEILSVTDATER